MSDDLQEPPEHRDTAGKHASGRRGIASHPLATAVVGAVVGAVAAALLTGGDKVVATNTQTIRPPAQTVTQIVTVDKSKGPPCSGSRVAGGSPYEPNEVVASAYGPLTTQPLSAALESDDDVDFYSFCLRRDAEVGAQVRETECRTFHPPGPAYCVGETVEMYDDQGNKLDSVFIDRDTTVGTLATRRRPRGQYFVRITGDEGLRYDLRVRLADESSLAMTIPPT